MKKGKYSHIKIKLIRKSLVILILSIIFMIGIFIAIFELANKSSNKKENDKLKNMIIDNQTKTEINTEINSKINDEPIITERMQKVIELKNENPEIIGWLEIPGSNISYPVLQTTDNEFYIKHNYKKEYSKDGALFLDKDYDWNLPSTNLLIYGHNNIGSSEMFVELMKYKKRDYYNTHKFIRFTTDKEDSEYKILSVFLSRVYHKTEQNVFRYYNFINAKTEKEFEYYVSNSKKASLYDTGVTAEYGDTLMTLSTCSYHTKNGRLAVVAKKIKE